MKSYRIFLAAAALLIVSLACGLTDSITRSEESTADSAPANTAPADDSTSAETPVQPDDSDSGISSGNELATGEPYDLDNPNFEIEPGLFNTYKASLHYAFAASNGITGTLLMEGETQLDPYATGFIFQSRGKAITGAEDAMTFAQVDGNEYMYSPDFGCLSGLIGMQGNPFDLAVDTYDVLTGKAAFDGVENVNGVETNRYLLTMANIDAQNGADLGIRELQEGTLHIARNGGYVVRLVLAGIGVNQGLSQDASLEGDVYYELNFYDFDQPVSINVPEGCAGSSSAGPEVPMPEDAYEVAQFGDILTFATTLSLEDVADFYEDTMPSYNCSEPVVVGDGSSMISMQYNGCDFGDVQIMLVLESPNKTTASIFIAP